MLEIDLWHHGEFQVLTESFKHQTNLILDMLCR